MPTDLRTLLSTASPQAAEPAPSAVAPSNGRRTTSSSCPPGAPSRTVRDGAPGGHDEDVVRRPLEGATADGAGSAACGDAVDSSVRRSVGIATESRGQELQERTESRRY